MTKLTKYAREAITRRATAFAFDPKKAALDEAEDKLAREAHAQIFSKAELEAIKKVPANWIQLDSCLRLNVGGQRIYLHTLDDGLPVPYRIGDYAGYSCQEIGTIGPGDLCDRIQAHAAALEQYKADRNNAFRQVKALLDSATTVKRLRDIWPQGEQFYAIYDPSPAMRLPAVPVGEINAILGLAA